MRKLSRLVLPMIGLGALGLIRCVGDAGVPSDGGSDVTTQNDGSPSDVNTNDVSPSDGSAGDGEAGPPPPPTPDGGIVWFNHYNMNEGMNDIATTDPQGNLVVVGSLRTCSGCSSSSSDYQTHIGGFALPGTPPSVGQDALIAKLNSSGSAVWARSLSAVPSDAGLFAYSDDYITSVAVDGNGDIYIAGYTQSHSITLKNTLNGPCAFVGKLSADGTSYLWDHAYTATGYVNSPILAVNGTKVAVTMGYNGTLSYDSGQNVAAVGNLDVFVGLLSTTDGSTTWHQSIGGSGNDSVSDVAMTSTGDVVIGGVFASATVAGNGTGFPLTQLGTNQNAFVAKLAAADGTALFTLAYGDSASAGDTTINAVAEHNGKLAIAGSFGGTNVDFGKGGGQTTTGGQDGFLVLFDESSKQTSALTLLTGDQYDYVSGVAFDAWGSYVATGVYGSTGSTSAKLGSQTLPNTGFHTQGTFVAKLDPTGNLTWVNAYHPTASDGGVNYSVPDAATESYLDLWGSRVRTDANGRVYVVGGMNGPAIWGSTGYQQRLSTLGSEYVIFCYPNPCPPVLASDGLVGAWLP